MKKLLFLLLPFFALAQNPTNFPYGVKIAPSGQPDRTTPAYLTTTDITTGLQGKIPFAYIGKPDERQAVNDANYTITGTANQIIAYTAITADRTVNLPAASTANQRIWITDESGLCSNARRIIVAPNGSDVIGGDSFAVINFPNGSGYLESNGSGKWNIISTTAIQFSAGVNTLPSITDNGDGSATIGTGVYSLFANTNGIGRPKAYQISGGTFTLTDQTTNYIYANYNTTTAVVSVLQTTVESTINNITTIPIYRIYRDGLTLHIADYDNMGLALSNKMQRSFEKTEPYRFQAGEVLIGESATRIITIGSGTVWQGGNAIDLASVASNVQTCYQFVNTSGTWSKSVVTQYNNTQYNAVGGLATLGNTNSYAVNYVFRSVGQDTDIAFVLGTGDYSLGQAQTAPIPSNLPTFITSHMVFVGRIIVQKNITTAAQIDSANTTGALFTTAGVTDHNALNNLQTAQTGVTYGHITDGAQTIAGNKEFTGNTIVSPASGIALIGESTNNVGVMGISTTASYPGMISQATTGGGNIHEFWNNGSAVANVDFNGNFTANAIDTNTTKITITTSVSITTATTDANGIGQNGRHVVLDNGVNAINLTCNGGVTTSYGKVGTGAVTFVQGSGRTLVQLSGTAILNGIAGSTATLWSNGTTDYLVINNY